MIAHLLTVGDEILIGQIIDTNSAWMAQQLNLQGIRVAQIRTVGDTHSAILQALHDSAQHADLVLITGGLGPTKDDITKKALAEFFDTKLVYHAATHQRIQGIFEKMGRTADQSHYYQSFMPESCTILRNGMGTAPGMWFEQAGKIFVSMPGVPFEMEDIMRNEVLPRLKVLNKGKAIAHRTILTAGQGESRLAEEISDFEDALPSNVKLAYLPSLGQVRLRLTAIAQQDETEADLEKLLDELTGQLNKLIPNYIFGYGLDSLQAALGRLLLDKQLTIATAESCTGGLLAHLITSVPGASAYFKGSIVAYANETKQGLLGVRAETLEKHGAVSEACVLEMAEGARRELRTDIAIAVSGIAGPSGGTAEKPVGTIWVAVADGATSKANLLRLGKDREKNIAYTASLCMNIARKFVLSRYF
jgi:nicotinamide-nucleotide amidase